MVFPVLAAVAAPIAAKVAGGAVASGAAGSVAGGGAAAIGSGAPAGLLVGGAAKAAGANSAGGATQGGLAGLFNMGGGAMGTLSKFMQTAQQVKGLAGSFGNSGGKRRDKRPRPLPMGAAAPPSVGGSNYPAMGTTSAPTAVSPQGPSSLPRTTGGSPSNLLTNFIGQMGRTGEPGIMR